MSVEIPVPVAANAAGWCLAVWSDTFSSWVSVAYAADYDRLAGIAARLAGFGCCEARMVELASLDDDGVEAALRAEGPSMSGFVVHHPGDDDFR